MVRYPFFSKSRHYQINQSLLASSLLRLFAKKKKKSSITEAGASPNLYLS